MTYLIVGLGNPGPNYLNTRHNTGFFFLESFRRTADFPSWQEDKKYRALVSTGRLGKNKVVLLLPQTFMNKSGESLKNLRSAVLNLKSNRRKKAVANLIVVHDDLDLPLGRFKISFGKSAGGHRGVLSVTRAVGTDNYVRLRIGISPVGAKGNLKKPVGEQAVIDHILGVFKPSEQKVLKKIVPHVSEALTLIVTQGRDRAMEKFNRSG
jgi:PTH1 family peptidyl-tRNA hydrolase